MRFLSRLLLALFIVFTASASARVDDAAAAGRPVDLEGRLETVHSDDFTRGRSEVRHTLFTDAGEELEVRFSTANPAIPRSDRVRVQGLRDGQVVHAGGGAQPAGGATVAATTGNKTVAVILLNFSNNPSQPYAPGQAAGIAFGAPYTNPSTGAVTNYPNSVAAYYAENSWGQLTMSGDVFGWVTVAATNTSCNYTTWANQADALVGSVLNNYQYKVYAFPSTSACGWSGLAYLPGTRSWLNGGNALPSGANGMSLRVMAHELGHNYGTHHASTLNCGAVAIAANTATCSLSEYGDAFTTMGSSSTRHHSNFAMGNFGWSFNTQTVLTSGDYLLSDAETDNSGVQALRVQRSSNSFLTLELRRPYGTQFDHSIPQGVYVRIAPGYSTMSQSWLVDTTPGSAGGFGDAYLTAGRSVYDPASNATVTAVSVSASEALIDVSFGPDATAPTTPANLSAWSATPTSIGLSWSPSSDNLAVAGYKVFRDGSQVATTTATSYTDSTGLVAGVTYSYTVLAFDAAGNESAPSNPASAFLDQQAPSQPTNLTATMGGKPVKVTLTWTGSTDNVAVTGYRIYRNGSLLTTVTSTSYTHKPPKGASTYYIVAIDRAGNVSPASSSVTVPK